MKNNRLIKHMVASMLLVIMTFSLCSCGNVDNKNSGGESSTTAPESTLEPVDENIYFTEAMADIEKEYYDFINYRNYLVNTNKKLTEDKELSVLFFGGSLTSGYGASDEEKYSWRGRTCDWFKSNYQDVEFKFINKAIGESGTYLGTFRLQLDVIEEKPDLIFMEYAINDMYFKSDYDDTAMRVETIIREIKAALPETEIIILITTDNGCLERNKKGELHTQGQAHEDMAKAYGISSLHIGRALAKECDYSKEKFADYAVDIVHLNDSGYEIYYKCIKEFLDNSLLRTDFTKVSMPEAKYEQVCDVLFDGNRTHIQPSAQLVLDSEGLGGVEVAFLDLPYTGNSSFQGVLELDDENDIFVLKFVGTEIAMWSNLKNKDYMVSVDGGAYLTKTASEHTPTVIARNLEPKEHTVAIKMAKGGSDFKIGAFFSRDTSKASVK